VSDLRQHSKILAMVKMGRPYILPGGMLAYALGVAIAYSELGAVDWTRAAVAFAVTETANLMTHYADEYADVDTDTLTRRTWFSGGSGVLPSGIVPPAWALRAAGAFAALAVALCVLGIAAGILPIHAAWIVALGMFGGWFYAMPPLALERRGLGEVDNALIGGILMPLMGCTAQTGAPSWRALAVLSPIFCIVLANLLAVHWADREADAAVGRRTVVVVAGQRARPLYYSLVVLAYGLTLALTRTVVSASVAAATLATLPLAVWAVAAFGRRHSALSGAFLMAAFIVAQTIGWALAR
jgi:1,4-dihydroxy-2-naphthoate octaprenyltransferase